VKLNKFLFEIHHILNLCQ